MRALTRNMNFINSGLIVLQLWRFCLAIEEIQNKDESTHVGDICTHVWPRRSVQAAISLNLQRVFVSHHQLHCQL